ncbi:MAG: hypothetical protein ABW168_06365 [Sedimenticola sp.]
MGEKDIVQQLRSNQLSFCSVINRLSVKTQNDVMVQEHRVGGDVDRKYGRGTI